MLLPFYGLYGLKGIRELQKIISTSRGAMGEGVLFLRHFGLRHMHYSTIVFLMIYTEVIGM